ncbi:hypothetical protein FA95DRAFT_1310655 [Auriscalpium vulgare]|uniref:Uncharacterized protein n=1 Tax=Auriscalpium vulgare TaxID=40419 RepID=A0ACB8RS95_9AGAM|nr:hypothetical protein FA95DRAFT_1310655 [Auriscalpium vulgare]
MHSVFPILYTVLFLGPGSRRHALCLRFCEYGLVRWRRRRHAQAAGVSSEEPFEGQISEASSMREDGSMSNGRGQDG